MFLTALWIYSLYGEQQDKVVLIRQYRYAINDFIYEFPAGLVEKQEPYKEAAVREMKEETGLEFTPITVNEAYEKPAFNHSGNDRWVLRYCIRYFSRRNYKGIQEDTEEIEVVLADREEVKRILKEEKSGNYVFLYADALYTWQRTFWISERIVKILYNRTTFFQVVLYLKASERKQPVCINRYAYRLLYVVR